MLVRDLDEVEQIESEIKCLTLVVHPNIVRLLDTFHTATRIYLVLECARAPGRGAPPPPPLTRRARAGTLAGAICMSS